MRTRTALLLALGVVFTFNVVLFFSNMQAGNYGLVAMNVSAAALNVACAVLLLRLP